MEHDPNGHPICQHALIRERQRGIKRAATRMILAEADQETSQNGGRALIWLSSRRLAELRSEGATSAALDGAANVFLVLAADGTLITLLNRRRATAERRKRQRRMSRGLRRHRPARTR